MHSRSNLHAASIFAACCCAQGIVFAQTSAVAPPAAPLPVPEFRSADIADPQTKSAVLAIEKKLAAIDAYTCLTSRQVGNAKGGTDSLEGRMAFQRPDKMLKDTTEKELPGQNIVSESRMVFDGAWSWERVENPPLSSEKNESPAGMLGGRGENPTYTKLNLAQANGQGLISVRRFLSNKGNLLTPFDNYRPATLKIIKETGQEWVFGGEMATTNNVMAQAPNSVVDKSTGFLKRLEYDGTKQGKGVSVWFSWSEVKPAATLSPTSFTMTPPAGAHVIDQTDSLIAGLKAQQAAQKK